MPTISQSEYDKILKQIQDAQAQINVIAGSQDAPIGDVGGGETSLPDDLTAAQVGGASGVGFETAEDQATISEQIEAASEAGVPKAAVAGGPPPTLSASQANFALRGAGLGGIVDPQTLVGLTPAQAQQKIAQEKAAREGQVSSLTSFAFNPETLNRTQKAIDRFGLAVDEISNDPFEHPDLKTDSQQNAVDITSRDLGKLFQSSEELYNAYNTNQAFKDTMDSFIQKGGSLEGVAKNITIPVAGQDVQGTDSFLANLRNQQANQEAQEIALNELAPESAIAQQEIARIANIPDDLANLYFGDEKTIGILEMRQKQAEEEAALIREQEKDAKRTARDRADLQMDRNDSEVKAQRATIEQNRLRAKNYMTAQLAKLGALKTTGSAPLQLEILEQKYTQQTQVLETAYDFASREIKIGLQETLDGIENKSTEIILSLQEDLTLDAEKMTKEVLKAQQAAEKETYKITEQYARRLRERTTKYTADLKKAAEKYAKEFAKNASGGIDLAKLAGQLGRGEFKEGEYIPGKGVLSPTGSITTIDLSPSQERLVIDANIIGADTVRYFNSLPTKFKQLMAQRAQTEGGDMDMNTLRPLYDQWVAEQEEDDEDLDFEDF